MSQLNTRTTLISMFIAIFSAAQLEGQSIDFEDLVAGTIYNNGDNFVSGGVGFGVRDFVTGGGSTVTTGTATVQNPNAAGSDNGIFMGNSTLDVGINPGAQSVGFAFAEFGGNVNLSVNGTLFNTDNFVANDGVMMGGFEISVSESMSGSNNAGFVTITGNLNQVSFGGQELFIDDLRLVPEPSALLLLIGSLIGIAWCRTVSA